jgi:hypothetical protein
MKMQELNNVIYIDFINKKRIYPDDGVVSPLPPPPDSKCLERRDAFIRLLDQGIVRTMIDGSKESAVLPSELKHPVAALNWSRNFDIPDLKIDDYGISGTLSFKQEPFHVILPWMTIFSMWNLKKPDESRVEWKDEV